MPAGRTLTKKRGGTPPFVATDEQRRLAMIFAAAGHTQKTIAAKLGISIDTMQRHLKTEWDEGRGFANSMLGEVLFKEAMKGDVQAIREWFDRRGGPEWRRRVASEHSGPDGSPIRLEPVPPRRDLSHLSEEELEQFHRLTKKIEMPDAIAQQ